MFKYSMVTILEKSKMAIGSGPTKVRCCYFSVIVLESFGGINSRNPISDMRSQGVLYGYVTCNHARVCRLHLWLMNYWWFVWLLRHLQLLQLGHDFCGSGNHWSVLSVARCLELCCSWETKNNTVRARQRPRQWLTTKTIY